ncbi:non-ribosomal peptide synthetase [Bradyrhizobium canariense]|uniref:non-ribosomal peptide synthetase n=1 Tax=Bradyrhizobium canariense TaxID=255045 RepID=UPI001C668A1F|nr:non-ribosomal peptide synthetase [Bradyrhizobium canariense]MBW5438033.1 non-ribosomal peptide synthetase [Bradyrhizobium canariense]
MSLTEIITNRSEQHRSDPWDSLTEHERAQLRRWNDTDADFPQVCTHELFELQVGLDPEAVAIIFGKRELSYRELNEGANKIAHYLRRRGVGPDALVGVCLERSPELVMALLAVWKAGGAYVPLDPSYPTERLSFMIDDAQPLLLLTDKRGLPFLSSWGDKLVCIDADLPMFRQESADNPATDACPSNLAYIMYTSGSTGKPKGAMIVHRGLVNYLYWAKGAYAVQPGEAVPVHTSISFDLTVTSLYTTLLGGGKVELLPEGVAAQSLLFALLNARNHGLVKITPAHLELLTSQIDAGQASGVARAFVIGGENLVAETLRLWRDHAPLTRLFNEYGPTETVVGCCVHEVRASDPYSGSVSIGRPIANTQLYVLDENMRPAAPGVTGELFIGGVGVGRGYLNRPELTAERFLPDGFSGVPGARLYKSGDLARFRNDGTLEYLGRADDQVKIRGYRIELGEIEANLAAAPDVQACVVLAREDEPGNKQLVGYAVSRNGWRSDGDELRTFLRAKLPEYMIPARFVFLDKLPLTSNGKVDRKALPVPSGTSTGIGGPPRTATEQIIAAMWSELLRLDLIGIHDDFFHLGGQSMTATGLVARLRAAFDVNIELATLFERPTIAGLSEAIDMLVVTSNRIPSRSSLGAREEFDL